MLFIKKTLLGKWKSRTVPFILLLTLIFFNGCSKKSTKGDPYQEENALVEQKSLIEKHIADPGKQAQLLEILTDFEMQLKKFSESQARQHEHIRELTADYNTTQEDFENSINDFNTQYEALLKNLAARRIEMKEITTPEEWKAISGKRKKSVLSN